MTTLVRLEEKIREALGEDFSLCFIGRDARPQLAIRKRCLPFSMGLLLWGDRKQAPACSQINLKDWEAEHPATPIMVINLPHFLDAGELMMLPLGEEPQAWIYPQEEASESWEDVYFTREWSGAGLRITYINLKQEALPRVLPMGGSKPKISWDGTSLKIVGCQPQELAPGFLKHLNETFKA